MSALLERLRSGKLAEDMAGLALNLEFVNGIGFDSVSRTPDRRRHEIRSRVGGSDGKLPRVTLKPAKIKSSDEIIAIHYDRSGKLLRALQVPTSDIVPLYEEYFQKRIAQSHIPWRKVQALPTAKDITVSLRRVEHLV